MNVCWTCLFVILLRSVKLYLRGVPSAPPTPIDSMTDIADNNTLASLLNATSQHSSDAFLKRTADVEVEEGRPAKTPKLTPVTSLYKCIQDTTMAMAQQERNREIQKSLQVKPWCSTKRNLFMPLPAFKLQGNLADVEADNPPLFRGFNLRSDQRRTLSWMLNQEQGRGFRGGILADQMGYGKTATTIGLISMDKHVAADMQPPHTLMHTKATLILCPPHLQQQWLDEFRKILGETLELWRVYEQDYGCSQKSSIQPHLSVLSIETRKPTPQSSKRSKATSPKPEFVRAFPSAVTTAMLQSHDVVIASTDLMHTDAYMTSVKALADDYSKAFLTSELIAALKNAFVLDWSAAVARLLALPFPVFQAFHWHRTITDEFHQIAEWDFKTRELFKGIEATCHWGLSGTPRLDTAAAVVEVARLLNYNEHVATPAIYEWLLHERDGFHKNVDFIQRRGLKLQLEVLIFLNACVRQNFTTLVDEIEVEEHIQRPLPCLLSCLTYVAQFHLSYSVHFD